MGRISHFAAAVLILFAISRPDYSEASFAFTKIDLKLPGECDALDRQLENRALVYRDAELEKYLAGLTRGDAAGYSA